MTKYSILVFVGLIISSWAPKKPVHSLQLQKVISDTGLTPKSVVHSGSGLFFSQNMMYSHNISVYNRQYERVKMISDAIDLSQFGYTQYEGKHSGAPVECAFSNNGLYAWVSNYRMYGKGFRKSAMDDCRTGKSYDKSFIYKINTQTLAIEQVVQAGAVPKYVATTPNSKYVLVSNWCSGDVSVIDCNTSKTVKTVYLGAYPRGIVVDSRSEKAYIALMGSSHIGVIDLTNFSVSWLKNIGNAPRHLCISPDNAYLYVSLNGEGKVAKVDLKSQKVMTKVKTGSAPRSMAMLGNGSYLYVCNYSSNTLSKIKTEDMTLLETVKTQQHPIGVTTDSVAQTIWVACYSGCLMVFNDVSLKTPINTPIMASVQTHKITPNSPNKPYFPFIYIGKQEKTPLKNENPSLSTKQQKETAKKDNAAPLSNGYYIIVGSYKTRTQAVQYIRELKNKGISKAQILNTDTHQYRIALNYFKTKAEAKNVLISLIAKAYQGAWILEI